MICNKALVLVILVLVALCITHNDGLSLNPATIALKTHPGQILGIVDPVHSCAEGLGSFHQLRLSDCEGVCSLIPGQVYNCEVDFLSGSSTSGVTIKIDFRNTTSGWSYPIINANLPNSAILPGFMYTIKFPIVPSDILSGQNLEFRAALSHTPTGFSEFCIYADMEIL